jgi:hypothetical protein
MRPQGSWAKKKKNGGVGLKKLPWVLPSEQAAYQLPLQNIFLDFSWMQNCMIWAFTSKCPF